MNWPKNWYRGSFADKYIYAKLRKKGWKENDIAKLPWLVFAIGIAFLATGIIIEVI